MHERRVLLAAFALYVALFAVLLHVHARGGLVVLYAAGIVIFSALVLLLRRLHASHSQLSVAIVGGAVLLQLVAITAGPSSSDDVYRYIWDGRVQFAGVDPYAYPPASPALAHLRDQALFPPSSHGCAWPIPHGCSLINRPFVRTVYPPVAQLGFAGVHLLSGGGVLPFQVLAALGVLAVTWLLLRWQHRRAAPRWPVALWAWSPLVVLEYGNNAHIDWLAVLLGLAGLAAAGADRPVRAGVLLAAATLTKLYPALLVPAALRRKPLQVLAAAATPVVLLYLPHVLAVGTDVVGYLPGYLHEEGYDSGARMLLLGALLPHPIDAIAGVLVVATIAVGCYRHTDPDAPERAAIVLLGATFLVATPAYGWYAGLLLALAVVAGRLEWVPVALAPGLVYLVRTEITHLVWPATSIYAIAGLVTLALALERRRSDVRRCTPVG
jgi:hypothetical protein